MAAAAAVPHHLINPEATIHPKPLFDAEEEAKVSSVRYNVIGEMGERCGY